MFSSILLSTLAVSLVTAAPSPSLNFPPSLTFQANDSSTQFISAAWYAGWEAKNSSFPINWQKFSHISWTFAVTTDAPPFLSLKDSGVDYVADFVKQAHDHGTVPILTIGGWTGSRYFSSAVTPENRSAFVQAVLDMVHQYGFDGVEFDWEFPNGLGIGCNQNSTSDAENFIAFLKNLRGQTSANGLLISAAVSIAPPAGSDGTPLTNVTDLANVLDHITIMNYDINGQWSNTVGPNAPLDDSCSSNKAGSAIKALKAWSDAGFPANQTVLGVPAYGHSFNVTSSNAVDSSGNLTDSPPFVKNLPDPVNTDVCGTHELLPDTINFSDLISQGFLNSNGTPVDGILYRFDNCSQTPFLYDKNKQLMVSYDDAQSFAAKGKFIVDNNLLGFSMWDVAGDSNDLLVDAILTAADATDDC